LEPKQTMIAPIPDLQSDASEVINFNKLKFFTIGAWQHLWKTPFLPVSKLVNVINFDYILLNDKYGVK